MKHFMYIIPILFGLTSCLKDKQGALSLEDHMQIQLFQPEEGEVFQHGETIPINGVIDAEFTMHGYIIRIMHSSYLDSVIFEHYEHVHGSSLTFSEIWINNLSESADILVEIQAVGNHYGTSDLFLSRVIHCLGE